MKGSTATVFLLLVSAFLLPGCSEKPVEKEDPEPAAEVEPEQDPDRIVLKDQSGATLILDCGSRLDAFLVAGTTEDFSVPVRIRFQGGESEARFREMTEMGPDEEDYWDFDEENGRFDVGWTIAFLRSLALADRLFLELKLSEEDRRALVFIIADEERATLEAALERNRVRVDNEMRTLGLGKYAPANAISPAKSDPLKVDLDDEALFFLYDEYIILVSKLRSESILPATTAEDRNAVNAMILSDKIHPFSSAFRYFQNAYPDSMEGAEGLLLDAGFESTDQFLRIGDRVQIGMAMIAIDNEVPGTLEQMRSQTDENLGKLPEGTRDYIRVIQAFREREWEWFSENLARFQRASGG
ncbi:MAG: hypothetical protein P1U85_06065 [Verrucomicrobiales bacterium]|nr:hypothetical protein [Verrucomicrobiales bacterium]